MKNKQKILIVSNGYPSKINHIYNAFKSKENLDVELEPLWIDKPRITFMYRVFNKLKIPLDSDNINSRMMEKIKSFEPDILIVIKGGAIYPWNFKQIKKLYPQVKLISWSPDDMYVSHNRSLYYTYSLKYYDVVFSMKSYNIEELKSLGAKKVEFLYQAYSNIFHKPCEDCSKIKNKNDVLFIGYAEKERFDFMNYLAQNGVRIDIYGDGWHSKEYANANDYLNIIRKPLLGTNYANALSCYKISLCFLRKANRDLHTSRSIEIPACGGFMIAERTDEHKKLFKEDKEAVYFDTKEALLEKVNYYIENEKERRVISTAGYNRTQKEKYSMNEMVDIMLDKI